MPRRLLVSVLALALLSIAGCGGDDGAAEVPPTVTGPSLTIRLTPLDVTVSSAGAAPRSVLRQELSTGATWDGGLEFSIGVEGLLSGRAIGDASLQVTDVDEEGNATAHYTLAGLDVALGTGNGDAGQTTPDALTIDGDVVVAPDRSGVRAATSRVAADGSVPGAESLAASLDPRLVFLLMPFPDEPVGIGAGWTISGPIPLFNTTVQFEAQVQLINRRGGHYTMAVTIGMTPDTPDGIQLDLRGLGRLVGDLNQLGPQTGTFGLTGTAVLPDRGPEPKPMTLRLDLHQRHSNAGADSTS